MKAISLEGRVALITGAARGIGACIARDFVRRGAQVVIADVLHDLGQSLANELGERARFAALDVRDEAAWIRVFDECEKTFGKPCILVNNAGIEVTSFMPHGELESIRRMFDVNVLGTFLGLKHGMRVMSKADGGKGGAIVNLASMAARTASPGFGPYGATKAAVERMTMVAAVEAGALGIGVRVNCLYPGIIESDMQTQLQQDLVRLGAFPDQTAITAAIVARTPLHRIGTPEDVACATAYLCSDMASFVNGVGLPVDGGLAIA